MKKLPTTNQAGSTPAILSGRRPVRLFVDAHVFDNEFQGTRTFLKEIYTLLAEKEDIRIFLAAHNTENLRNIFSRNDRIHFLSYKSRSSFVRLGWEIPALLKIHAIDWAHFQYITPLTKHGKYIVTIHDTLFADYPGEFSFAYRFSKKLLFKRSARAADRVTTVSTYSKKSISRFLDIDPASICITPNGVSQKFFAPYDRQQSINFIGQKFGLKNFVLFVSRIEPRKNHLSLLKAWLGLELYKKSHPLVFLGYRSIRIPEFDRLLDELPANVRKMIYIDSKVDDEDLLEFYRAAAVFVYPSRAEGFGIPPLEAAALRVPVLCSNTSAMEDFSFFGDYRFDPLDQTALQNKLAEILAHPPTEAFLEQLSLTVQQQYSWRLAAGELYKIITKSP